MSFISKIFTGGVDINKALDIVSKGADKLVFTQEERADLNKETTEGLSQFIKDTASENTARSITRRYVAILVIVVYLLISLVIIAIGIWSTQKALELVKLTNELDLGTAFIAVIAFFFSSYMLKKFVPESRPKKGNQ
jgi:hypothetical protein